MIHIKKLWLPLLITYIFVCSLIGKEQTFRLSQFDHKSAAVLPTFTHRNIKWAILSREAYGRTKKYTYDAFSGGKDKGETHPIQTAAHEFLQEAILERTLEWNLEDVENFIDPDNEYTWVVVAYDPSFAKASEGKQDINPVRNVTYIVNFNKYKTKLFKKFYDARIQEKKLGHYALLRSTSYEGQVTTEKDRLAKVRWRDLERAIINQENKLKTACPSELVERSRVTVSAYVLNPETRKFNKETITLRPILVMTLRPFFLGCDHEQGENEKIRYYNE